jgi:hypothetical protein
MSKSEDSPRDSTRRDLGETRLARRKLLKLTAYAAPAIIGTFTMRAAAQATCPPPPGCNPQYWPCLPDLCGPDICRPARRDAG